MTAMYVTWYNGKVFGIFVSVGVSLISKSEYMTVIVMRIIS